MYINYIIKLRRCVRREGKETGRKGIYYQFGCLVNIYTEQNRIQVAVLAELSRIQQAQQNIVECGRLPLDCYRLPVDCHQIIISRLVSSCCVSGNRWKQVNVYKVLQRCPVIEEAYKHRRLGGSSILSIFSFTYYLLI